MRMIPPYRQLGGYRLGRCTLKSQQLVERRDSRLTGDFRSTSSPGQAVVNERSCPAAFPVTFPRWAAVVAYKKKVRSEGGIT